jgi:hypothetical protein
MTEILHQICRSGRRKIVNRELGRHENPAIHGGREDPEIQEKGRPPLGKAASWSDAGRQRYLSHQMSLRRCLSCANQRVGKYNIGIRMKTQIQTQRS